MGRPANRATALLAVASLVLVPAAGLAQGSSSSGQAEEITFYGHVFGVGMGEVPVAGGGSQPANTQPPIGETNLGSGIFHWCTEEASASNTYGTLVDPNANCREDQENVLALFSTAGEVDYTSPSEFVQEGGYAGLHNERGQTKDILLGDDPVQAGIFVTVDRHGWAGGGQPYGTQCTYPHPPGIPCLYPYWGWDVGTQPQFTVQSTLYQADLGDRTNSSARPPVGETIAAGEAEIVAQGSTTQQLPVNGVPGSPDALHYTVDLGPPEVDRIDRDNDFFITYRFYSESSGQAWGLASWRVWSGEFFPPTFTMPVENPVTVERVIPTFVHGKMAILGVMNTPWGSYDIDAESVDLEVEAPDGTTVPEERFRSPGLSRSVAHGGHFIPVNQTWIWDYQRSSDLEPGNYTVTLSTSNLQGSASASCTASFTLREGQQDRLVPGEAVPGACGQQTISEEQAEELEESVDEPSDG